MKSEQPSVFDSLIDADRSATPFDTVLVRMLVDRLLAWPEGRGFKALIENFRDADMTREVDSWLGPTSPQVVSPTAFRRVIGPKRVLDAEWLHEVVTAAKAPEAEVVCSATRT